MTLVLTTAVPLATALLLVIGGPRLGRIVSAIVGASALLVALGASIAIAQAFGAGKTSLVAELGPWIPIRGAGVALIVDPRTIALLLATTAIGAAIGVYAAVTMRRDPAVARLFVSLDLLVGALVLVLAARDLILLLAGWELVGVSGYLLVARERHRAEAALAATGVFVLARAADAAFMVASFALLAALQTVDVDQIAALTHLAQLTPAAFNAVRLASALFVVAASIRAAQFLFQLWRADRSRVPAPLVIATRVLVMVSGAFLLVRLAPVLDPVGVLAGAALGIASAILATPLMIGGRRVAGSVARIGAVLFEQGGERAIATTVDAVARATLRASAAIERFDRSAVWAHEALLLAAALVIVVYWIVR